jgi:hypothetical protein
MFVMKRAGLAASIAIAISTIGWSSARADAYDDANRDSQINLESQRTGAAAIKDAINVWMKNSSHTCDGLTDAFATVQAMETESEKAHELQDSADVSSAARERYREADSYGTPIFLGSYLDIADAYLTANCFKEANGIYRGVIRQYIGNSYAAFRERASIGIDDVRAGQQAATPK